MKHYGDIKELIGGDLAPVDVVCGGSPCQDLSISGHRKGFEGERSSLFLEQIRVIKEMRERDKRNGISDELIRPRYMLWENVVGALSSRGGQDFARVIEETIKIADESIPNVQVPEKGWTKAGCYYDDMGRWSIAWRVHDAQFWGVPQRRKRIALVADFGGLSAPEILFERKRLQWDSDKTCSKKSTDTTSFGANTESSSESTTRFESVAVENHANDSRYRINNNGIVQTLTQRMGTGGNNVPLVLEKHTFSQDAFAKYSENSVSATIMRNGGQYGGGSEALIVDNMPNEMKHTFTQEAFANYQEKETSPTLRASGGVYGGGSETLVCDKAVRKLTPLECERLQGFPDNWTNVNGASDTKRYKALGNSIALPYWKVLARRISAQYDRDITIGSLFDGIGGFPLAFEHCGGKALWASEIEEFPIEVTKYHFGDE